MADVATLDDLLGPDPDASGNSDAQAGQPSPAPDAASQGTPAGGTALEARLAELEQTAQRNLQRLHGAEEAAKEQRARAEQAEQAVQALAARLETLGTQPSQPEIPAWFVQEANDLAGYDLDRTELAQRWARIATHTAPATPPQPQQPTGEYLTRQDLEQFDRQKVQQQQAIQAVLAEHPELGENRVLTEVLQEYDTLRNDPSIALVYPEAQSGPNVVVFNNRTFDLRLIDKAAQRYKSRAGEAATARNQPTLSGGPAPHRAAPDNSPTIPRAMVEENGVFTDPQILQTLKNAGWGGNTRQQLEHMLSKLTPAQRAALGR